MNAAKRHMQTVIRAAECSCCDLNCLGKHLLSAASCRRRPDVVVSERPLTVGELMDCADEGRLLEVFGSGTACVVQPVGCIVTSDGRELTPASSKAGHSSGSSSIAAWVRQLLLDIQYGRIEHPWSVPFE